MSRNPRKVLITQVLGLIALLAFSFALAVVMAKAAESADGPPTPPATRPAQAAVPGLKTDHPAVLLFLRPGQPQSAQAMADVLAAAKAATADPSDPVGPSVQLLAVLSGEQSAEQSKAVAETWPGRVVADPDYSLAGKLDVHVWPTTVVLASGGGQIGHLAGLPRDFDKSLDAYFAFLTGRIDRAALDERLSATRVIEDDPAQMARRHLLAADRLLTKGLVGQARQELEQGLQRNPKDVSLQLALARTLLLLDQPDAAMALLDRVDPTAAPPWRINTVRGRALIALGRWDQAAALLVGAVKLNPDPAEAHYALGLVYQHQEKWQQAAGAFRAAFEATGTGRSLVSRPPAPAPAVRP